MSRGVSAKPAPPRGDAGRGTAAATPPEMAKAGQRTETRMPVWTAAGGFALLQIAVVATGLLALHSLAGLAMPGCGAGSPCDLAANSRWGKVPGTDIPVSIVGLAFFLGLLQAWFTGAMAGGVGTLFKWVVRAGAVASAGFVVLSI